MRYSKINDKNPVTGYYFFNDLGEWEMAYVMEDGLVYHVNDAHTVEVTPLEYFDCQLFGPVPTPTGETLELLP